jgi:L-alanine-DL-glutamate epimerase-like enolase superfamily enzyme
MTIAVVEVIGIRAPRKEVVRAGSGISPVTHSEFGIVRILTEDGLEGVGEISITAPRIGLTLCHAADTLVGPAIVGLDEMRLPVVMAAIDRALMGELSAPYLRAAFEMAVLDLQGKRIGCPVFQLLGGKARDRVALAWGIYQKAPAEMAADARVAVEAGYAAIKLKVGRRLEEDLAAVRAVVAAIGPDVPLRLDANMAWKSVPEAVAAIDAFAAIARIAWVEQPLPRTNLDGLRLLRQRSRVPIMADESLQTPFDAWEVARREAADVFNVYLVEAGGILPARQILDFAATLDIPCILGSQAELGIGTAAAAHLAVATGSLTLPIETFGPLRYPDDIVVATPRIDGGHLYPPDGPGLGVELDWAVIDTWRAPFRA